jgi:hypothetical protein
MSGSLSADQTARRLKKERALTPQAARVFDQGTPRQVSAFFGGFRIVVAL